MNIPLLKTLAAGRWPELLASLGGLSAEIADRRHHPCPKCGGVDRFRVFDDFPDTGGVICNQCGRGLGDGLAALQWLTGWDFITASKAAAKWLGVDIEMGVDIEKRPADPLPAAVDPLGAVAREKHCPRESLIAYGAEVRSGAVVFPMYDECGRQCSTFTIVPGTGKGMNEKGKPAGMFLPCGSREPGWALRYIVEGVKDAAALHGIGHQATGLPTSAMNERFAPFFAGADVVIIPDSDKAGIEGANKTAQRLRGIAKSVKICRLPAEITESNGSDVRDILQQFGDRGPEAIEKAIREAKPWSPASGIGPQADGPPRFTQLLTSAELCALDLKPQYLVREILLRGQPMVVGGRTKTLKTSLILDLIISLSSGTSFLGHFPTKKTTVGIWSGESGASVIRETAIRIAAARDLPLANTPIYWGFDLPHLSDPAHLSVVADIVRSRGIGVVVVDPLYLSLMTGAAAGQSSDLFNMGRLLQPLTELGQQVDCTFIILHHFRKGTFLDESEPAGLEELAQSGTAEWARQWILLQRRVPYNQDGHHELWMRYGGSAGHAGLVSLVIDEGRLDPETLSGRHWSVKVERVADAKATVRAKREKERADISAKKQEVREDEHLDRLRQTLRKLPDGGTIHALRDLTGLNTKSLGRALRTLQTRGQLRVEEVQRPRVGLVTVYWIVER